MTVTFIKIAEDGLISARESFTRDELHLALDDKVTLLRIEDGITHFYNAEGEWRILATTNEDGVEVEPAQLSVTG